MNLYEEWIKMAYNERGEALANFWDTYMPLEQKIYEEIIGKKTKKIKGSVEAVAKKYNFEPVLLMGFLDGINDASGNTLVMEELTLETEINIAIDFESLFKKMVEYKAEHLYSLPQWEKVFTAEEREKLIKEQKTSKTVVKDKKIGRNEPCPCASGKKYKQCCGK